MEEIIKRAFTLIELLVVIAIIGILSGLIIVSMSGVTNSANIAKGQIFSNSLRNALMMSLVSEWKFDQVNVPAVNQTPDSWSGGNTGTLYGPGGPQNLPQLQTTGCVSGNCLKFDGTDDYVLSETADFCSADSQGTISSWVKSNSASSWQIIFSSADFASSNRYIELFFRNDGKIGLAQWNADGGSDTHIYGGTVLSSNTWYYVVITSDGLIYKIYINGVEQSLSVQTGVNNGDWLSDTSNRDNWAIGAMKWNGGTANYMNGLIDDVRIYNAAVPTSQIKEQYYSGLNNMLMNGSIPVNEYLQRINNAIAQND